MTLGSFGELVLDGSETPNSTENNVTEPVTESNNFLNSTLTNNQVETGTPGNDSVANDTIISNATLIKKFTCLLEDTQEGNSTFQVFQNSLFFIFHITTVFINQFVR